MCEETVKLLGIEIDYLLNFDTQVSNMCKKASQQINVLKRKGKHLNLVKLSTLLSLCLVSIFVYLSDIFVQRLTQRSWGKNHFRALKFIFQHFDASYEKTDREDRNYNSAFVSSKRSCSRNI